MLKDLNAHGGGDIYDLMSLRQSCLMQVGRESRQSKPQSSQGAPSNISRVSISGRSVCNLGQPCVKVWFDTRLALTAGVEFLKPRGAEQEIPFFFKCSPIHSSVPLVNLVGTLTISRQSCGFSLGFPG